MMDQAAMRQKEEQQKILKRDNEVAAKFAKLEQWKKELNDKIAKKTAEANAAKVVFVCNILLNIDTYFINSMYEYRMLTR